MYQLHLVTEEGDTSNVMSREVLSTNAEECEIHSGIQILTVKGGNLDEGLRACVLCMSERIQATDRLIGELVATLDMYNAPDMLDGYLTPIAEHLNPELEALDYPTLPWEGVEENSPDLPYVIYADREGDEYPVSAHPTQDEAIADIERRNINGTWPEGSDAVIINNQTHVAWIYIDYETGLIDAPFGV